MDVAKNLLTSNTSFFATGLNGQVAEASTRAVNLHQHKSEKFRTFVQWLQNSESMGYDPIVWVETHGLGGKLGCHRFSDYLMCRLVYNPISSYLLPETAIAMHHEPAEGLHLRRWG